MVMDGMGLSYDLLFLWFVSYTSLFTQWVLFLFFSFSSVCIGMVYFWFSLQPKDKRKADTLIL